MTKFDKEMLNEFLRGLASAAIMTILLVLLCAMCGCKTTEYVPVETVRTEYREADTTAIYNRLLSIFEARKERESRSDSVIDRTKESATVNENGDTIKIERTRYVYMSSREQREYERTISEKDSIINDLQTRLASVRADSVPVPYPVERKLSRWEQTKMDLGGVAFGGVIVALGIIAWLALRRRRS